MATRMQQRRGTSTQWISTNSGRGPILNAGEIGYETNTNKFKIGDGINHWVDLNYFVDAESILGGISGVDLPAALDTLNEIAAALGDDANYATTITTALGNKQDKISGVSDTEIGYLDGVTSSIQTQLNSKLSSADLTEAAQDAVNTALVAGTGLDKTYDDASNTITLDIDSTVATKTYADTAVSTHSSDTTDVHGISNTAELATKTFAAELLTGATKSNITITGDKNGLTITAENGVADSTTDNLTEGSTNKYFTDERAQDAVGNAIGTGLTYTDATGEIKVDTTTIQSRVTGVSDTEIGYLDGVTSAIQTQIDAKLASSTASTTYAPIASPTFTGTVAGVTKSMVGLGNVDNTSDANKPVSSATQTALDTKLSSSTAESTYAPIANPTFTGTVAGVTKSMVGLANVDNTSDANKPISSATQTALDAKLSKSGGTMTGALTLSGAPTSDLHAATKFYVDGIASGINFHAAAKVATTGNLSTTYLNGTSGYGATLTADTNRAFNTVDGVTGFSVGDRILVRAQTDAKQNGIYTLTSVGSSSEPWVLTRATDDDNNPSGEMSGGDFCFVTSGSVYGSTGFILSNTGTISIGTDNVNYVQFNASQAINAGTGLSKTGGTLSIDTATTVDLSTSQTLTNKTLTSPTITGTGSISGTFTGDITGNVTGNVSGNAGTVSNGVYTTDTGTVTSTMIANGTIVDADINASAAIAQSKVSNLTSDLADKAPLAGPTFTGTVTLPSTTSIGNVSATEIGYVDGVTSAIQTQLDAKLSTSTAASTYQPLVTGVSDTEIGYLDGVTSAIQTQLDAKIAKSLVDAKGDILVASADNTVTRLGVGTNGYLLTANSSATNGIEWAAAPVSLPSQSGKSGKYLTTDGTNASWDTVSSYSAPTLGSTSIASGATVTTIEGLTKVVSVTRASLDANGYEVNPDLMFLMGAY